MIDTERGGHGATGRPPLPPVTTQWATPGAADPGAAGRMLPPFYRASRDALAAATASTPEVEEVAPAHPPIQEPPEAAVGPPAWSSDEEPQPIELFEAEVARAEPVDVLELEAIDAEMEEIGQTRAEPVGFAAEFEDELVLEDVYDDLDTGPTPGEPAEFAPEGVALETEAPYDADAGYDLDAMMLPESMAEAELALTDEVENFLIDTGIAAAPELGPGAEPVPYVAALSASADDQDLAPAEDEGWAPGEPPPPGFVASEAGVVEETGDLAGLPPEEDQPWEAFGRALQEALSWAGLAAEETPPEPAPLFAEAPPVETPIEPPIAEAAEAGWTAALAEEEPPIGEAETGWEEPALPVAAVEQPVAAEPEASWEPVTPPEPAPEAAAVASVPEVFEPPPIPPEIGQRVTGEAAPAATGVDPVAADLADRLQALAERLRTAGLGGLADAIARGDRLESSLALFIAGYRAGRDE